MAVVNGYCSVEDLRGHLGDTDDQLDTGTLERAINAASRAIDRYCGRQFWLDSDVATRTYRVLNNQRATVDDFGTKTGLVVKTGIDGVNFTTTLTIDADFIVGPQNAEGYASANVPAFAYREIILLGGRWFTVDRYRPTLSVTAKHGWSAIPDDIVEACLLKATSLFKRKDAPFGVAGFGEFGAVRISRKDPDVADMLEPYQLVGLA